MPLHQLLFLQEQQLIQRQLVLREQQQQKELKEKEDKAREEQEQQLLLRSTPPSCPGSPTAKKSTNNNTAPPIASTTNHDTLSLSLNSSSVPHNTPNTENTITCTPLSLSSPSSSSLSAAASVSKDPSPTATSSNPTTTTHSPSAQGHMLLMLVEGRHKYYENGTLKRGPEWEDDGVNLNVDNDDDEEADVEDASSDDLEASERIDGTEEEGESTEEEGGVRKETEAQRVRRRALKGKEVVRSGRIPIMEGALRQYQHFLEAGQRHDRDQAQGASRPEQTETEVQEDGEVEEGIEREVVNWTVFASIPPSHASTPLLSSSPALAATTALPDSPTSGTSTPSASATSPQERRVSGLGRLKGTKTRASVSYSVLPTLGQPTLSSYSYPSQHHLHPRNQPQQLLLPSNITTTTFASNSSLSVASTSSTSTHLSPYLRPRGSGSMINPGYRVYGAGGASTVTTGLATMNTTTSSTSSSPLSLSWNDLSQYPTSASSLLLDTLSKPMAVAYLLQQHKHGQVSAAATTEAAGSTSSSSPPAATGPSSSPRPHHRPASSSSSAASLTPSTTAHPSRTSTPATSLSRSITTAVTSAIHRQHPPSPLQPSPKPWLRKPLLRVDTFLQIPTSTTSSPSESPSTFRHPNSASLASPPPPPPTADMEKFKEMGEGECSHRDRVVSMIELSASTSPSRFKASLEAAATAASVSGGREGKDGEVPTRQRYKTLASTCTSSAVFDMHLPA